MDPAWLTLLLFGSLVFFLLLGLPIAFTLGGLAMIFILWLWGPAGLLMMASHAYGESMNFILVSAPLFILMAVVLEGSGDRRRPLRDHVPLARRAARGAPHGDHHHLRHLCRHVRDQRRGHGDHGPHRPAGHAQKGIRPEDGASGALCAAGLWGSSSLPASSPSSTDPSPGPRWESSSWAGSSPDS